MKWRCPFGASFSILTSTRQYRRTALPCLEDETTKPPSNNLPDFMPSVYVYILEGGSDFNHSRVVIWTVCLVLSGLDFDG